MSNAPVTQADLAAATVWCDNVVDSMNSGIVIGRNHMLKLLRAIAERDAEIDSQKACANTYREHVIEQTLQLRDAREDLANYRASAEEQIAELKQKLAAVTAERDKVDRVAGRELERRAAKIADLEARVTTLGHELFSHSAALAKVAAERDAVKENCYD